MSNRTISCIQPTGRLHIGNYLGAVKMWLAQQNENKECIFGVADLHSLSKIDQRPSDLKKNTNDLFIDLLACGLKLDKCSLFVQSLVPEHSELAWILGHVANFKSLLEHPHFNERRKLFNENKPHDKIDKLPVISLNYPLLQAADILIYKAVYVPIGYDQEINLKFVIELAKDFNERYEKEIFTIPEVKMTKTPFIKSLIDPNIKMSKSQGEEHKINLFEDENKIREKIKNAYPNPAHKAKGNQNLIDILQGFNNESYKTYNEQSKSNSIKENDLKEELIHTLIDRINNFRTNRLNFESIGQELLMSKLREESNEARSKAQINLSLIKENIGIKKLSYI